MAIALSIMHEVTEVLFKGIMVIVKDASEFFEGTVILQPVEVQISELVLTEADKVIRMQMVVVMGDFVVLLVIHLWLFF